MAQDETAVQHKPQYILEGGGDRTQNPSIGSIALPQGSLPPSGLKICNAYTMPTNNNTPTVQYQLGHI